MLLLYVDNQHFTRSIFYVMITITDHMSFVQPMNNWFGVSLYQYTAEGNIFPSDNFNVRYCVGNDGTHCK